MSFSDVTKNINIYVIPSQHNTYIRIVGQWNTYIRIQEYRIHGNIIYYYQGLALILNESIISIIGGRQSCLLRNHLFMHYLLFPSYDTQSESCFILSSTCKLLSDISLDCNKLHQLLQLFIDFVDKQQQQTSLLASRRVPEQLVVLIVRVRIKNTVSNLRGSLLIIHLHFALILLQLYKLITTNDY